MQSEKIERVRTKRHNNNNKNPARIKCMIQQVGKKKKAKHKLSLSGYSSTMNGRFHNLHTTHTHTREKKKTVGVCTRVTKDISRPMQTYQHTNKTTSGSHNDNPFHDLFVNKTSEKKSTRNRTEYRHASAFRTTANKRPLPRLDTQAIQ